MIETARYNIQTKEWVAIFEVKTGSPVIISVPHDGLPFNSFSGLFEPRKVGHKGRDRNVWSVAKDVINLSSSHAVRGLMPRTLVDYNRAWPKGINYYPLTQKEVHTALDDARLVLAYLHYHMTIDRLIKRSLRQFGNKTLLIDLHGFKNSPPYSPEGGYDLILGTGNRITVPHGDVDKRLAEFMTERGYQVFLPTDITNGPQEDWYSADFITRRHSEKHRINAIQVEIASRFRESGAYALGARLSSDFAEFIRSHCSA